MKKKRKAGSFGWNFRFRVPRSGEWLVSALLVVADMIFMNWIFLATFRFWLKGFDDSATYLNAYLHVRIWLLVLYLSFGAAFDIFRLRSLRSTSDLFSHSSATLLSTFISFNLLVFLYRPLAELSYTFPRPIILISTFFSTAAVFALRAVVAGVLKPLPILKKALIVGDEAEGKRIIKHFHRRGSVRFRLIEILPAESIDELSAKVFLHHIDEVIVTDPQIPLDRFWADVFFHRKEQPHNFYVRVAYNPLVTSGSVGLASLEDFPLNTLCSLPLSQAQRLFKRGFDIVFALFSIALTSPLMILGTFLARYGSPGSIFYYQKRVGRYGKIFNVIKFRSMHIGSESKSGPIIATANDPRMTRFGNFLRRFAIDELPQFFLVLMGEMSVVGPRPERPFFVQKHHEFQGRRLSVRPGLSGLAAVNARYYLRLVDKVGYDYYYLDHYSLVLDIKIIFQTVWVLLFDSNKALEDKHHALDGFERHPGDNEGDTKEP